MVSVRIILDPGRNVRILRRFSVRHDDDERFTAADLRRGRCPRGRVVASKKVRVPAAGVGDIAGPGRAGFTAGQRGNFRRAY